MPGRPRGDITTYASIPQGGNCGLDWNHLRSSKAWSHFAALPRVGAESYNQGMACGACVKVRCSCNQDQFEDVMKILSKDVAGRVTVTCGIMVGCPMLGGILVNMALAKFGRPSAARPCGSLLFTLLEPQFPTIVSLVLMLLITVVYYGTSFR